MKYNISINQLALFNIDKNLDIKDGAILDYLMCFCSADDKKIDQIEIREKGETYRYTWINYGHLIKELPLLKINNTASISERISKLKKTSLIKTHKVDSPAGKKIYIRITEKVKSLFFNNYSSPLVKTIEPISLNKEAHKFKLSKHYNNKHYNNIAKSNFPQTNKEVINKLKNSKQRHLRIVGLYAEYKSQENSPAVDFWNVAGITDEEKEKNAKKKYQDFIRRNIRCAKKLEPFKSNDIFKAFDLAKWEGEKSGYRWSIETALKKLE